MPIVAAFCPLCVEVVISQKGTCVRRPETRRVLSGLCSTFAARNRGRYGAVERVSWLQPVPSEVRPVPEGYCVKEKKKVEIQDPKQVTMKNGRPAIQGTCPDCGTKIFKIGKLE